MILEEIYVAIKPVNRYDCLNLFQQKYLDNFQPENNYFEYPPYFGKTVFETDDYKKMLDFILKGHDRSFKFYFKNEENEENPKARIFLNEDQSMFLGLAVRSELLTKYEEELNNDFQLEGLIICNEVLPPDNIEEFLSIIKKDNPS